MKSIRNKIILTNLLATLLGFAVLGIIFSVIINRYIEKYTIERLENVSKAAQKLFREESAIEFAKVYERVKNVSLLAGARITIADRSGRVWFDSEVPLEKSRLMENHYNREEFKAARESGVGYAVRYSETLKKDMVYRAIFLEKSLAVAGIGDLAYVRTAIPLIDLPSNLRFPQEALRMTKGHLEEASSRIQRILEKLEYEEYASSYKQIQYLAKLAECRITLIDADGVVRYESDVPFEKVGGLENHGSREEVLAAKASGIGKKKRFSETLGRNMFYRAALLDPPMIFGGITRLTYLRTAVPLLDLDAFTTAMQIVLLGSCAGGLVIMFLVSFYTAKRLTVPITELSRTAEAISAGNLDAPLPKRRSHDEIGEFHATFGKMQKSLAEYIVNLRETTAAKERIESELNIARQIQMGILPRIFPPFPDREEFDIFASIIPAREVGGDLYDFFFIDEDNLCISIGDVSGKGVPAALLMAVTKTLIKTIAVAGVSPGEVMTKANAELASENEACMFITEFFGIFNIKTGTFNYSNGGHNPPLIRRRNGEIETLAAEHGPALGVVEGVEYLEAETRLEEGDILLLYTDGVTEAIDPEEKEFTEERLCDLFGVLSAGTSRDVVEKTIARIREFARGAEQSDDITMLVLTRT